MEWVGEHLHYINFCIYMCIGFCISIINRKSIWKGICGGNGVPQPDELIKMAVLIAVYFDFGQIQFLERPVDYAYLGMQFTVLGLSAFSAHQNTKLRTPSK